MEALSTSRCGVSKRRSLEEREDHSHGERLKAN